MTPADEGISGKNIKDRPAVSRLIGDIKKGYVKNVLVFKIDRLTRSTADLMYLVDLFNQYDCGFNSLMESIDTQTPSGRMFLKIIGIFAEFERENIIERIKLGVERKVKEGYSMSTAYSSFGYDRPKNQKIQTINEEEAEIVREIFDLYVNQGFTLTNIARTLNIRKIQTKADSIWSSTKIRRVLQNCNYVGDVRRHIADYKTFCSYEGLHKAIISQELFDKAQGIIEKNQKISPNKKPSEDKYFSGFLICDCCGYKLKAYNTRKNLKTRVLNTSGYVCGNRTLKTCTTSSMSHKKVEIAFEDYISRIVDLNVSEDINLSGQEQKKQNKQEQIKTYEAKIRQLEEKEKEALKSYVDNDLELDTYRVIKGQVDNDKQFIYAELERLQIADEDNTLDKNDIMNNLKENWTLLSPQERRQFLMQFIEKINVISEKDEGGFFGIVKIKDVVFRKI